MEKTLTIRVGEEDLVLWKDAAWRRRMSLSSWVREVLSVASAGGLGAGDVPGVAVTGDAATDGEARGGVIPPRSGVRIPSSPAPSSSFRPDPKVKK